MKKISLILISLLFINFHLYSRQLYIWSDQVEKKLFCFDRETEILVEHSISKKNYPHCRIESVTYISNFVAVTYNYFPELSGPNHVRDYRTRGGIALLDIRDGNYREYEASDLVNNYFSTTLMRRDVLGGELIFGLVNVEDYGVGADTHEIGRFRWNPNESSTPTPISKEEYLSLISRVYYDDYLGTISNKTGIETKYTNGDYVFFYNGKMEVWSHKEERYYTLRSIPDFESKNASVFLNNGYPEDQIRDKHRKYRRMHFISVDGMRSVKMVR